MLIVSPFATVIRSAVWIIPRLYGEPPPCSSGRVFFKNADSIKIIRYLLTSPARASTRKTYCRKCQPPLNSPADKSDKAVRKPQIHFLNHLQTCRSSKFTFWTICRRAEAPNLLFEPIASVQKPQIYFFSQLQACRSLKFTFWTIYRRAEAKEWGGLFGNDFSRAASPDPV